MTTTDELVAVLAKVDLFDGLDAKLLRRIADSGRVETFAPARQTGGGGKPGAPTSFAALP